MIVNKYYKVIRVLKDGGDGPTPFYIENISGEDGVFFTGSTNSNHTKRNLMYKVDDGEWFEYTDDGTMYIDVPNGSRIYLKGNNSVFSTKSEYYNLKLTQKSYTYTNIKYNIGGYLTSLLQTAEFDKVDTIPDYAFYKLFSQQKVVSAKYLITDNIKNVGVYAFSDCFRVCKTLTTLPEGMFSGVTSVGGGYTLSSCFQGCTSLTTLPEGMFSGVTSVGGNCAFKSCFSGCTSLTTLPEGMFGGITLIGQESFTSCFQGCTSLTNLPEGMFSGVTSVGDNTFQSCFQGCTSLTTLPEGMFSGVTSVSGNSFYDCFQNCTSLTTLPEVMFSGVTSVIGGSFKQCFQNCTSLLVGPNFKKITGSTSHDAFDECFKGCTNLQLIYAPSMSSWKDSYFQDWVSGVYPTGKMYVKSGVVPPTGASGVPEGWQLLNY